MDIEEQREQARQTLQTFLDKFKEYATEVYGNHNQQRLDELRSELQQQEPAVTKCLVDILGNPTYTSYRLGQPHAFSLNDLLTTTLLGGNNEMPHNFSDYDSLVTSAIN
ncbi:MAG: hypothetical protein WBC55_02315, partial [Dehalococcoidia bacterium]